MGWRRSITLFCDNCDDNIGSADLGDETVAQARDTARTDGHHVALPGGRDICADCWHVGER